MTLYINILLFRKSDGDTDRADLQGAGKAGEDHRQELQHLQEMGWLPSREVSWTSTQGLAQGARLKNRRCSPEDATESWLT